MREKLRPLLEVNQVILSKKGLAVFMIDLTILFVWMSCIYKENFFSLILFGVLLYQAFSKNVNSMYFVRTTVVIILVLEYWF